MLLGPMSRLDGGATGCHAAATNEQIRFYDNRIEWGHVDYFWLEPSVVVNWGSVWC
jgi:hypothetical protein